MGGECMEVDRGYKWMKDGVEGGEPGVKAGASWLSLGAYLVLMGVRIEGLPSTMGVWTNYLSA